MRIIWASMLRRSGVAPDELVSYRKGASDPVSRLKSQRFFEGGSDYRQTFGNGPFAYAIRYDPRYINALDRYRLVATLYDANRQVVASATQIQNWRVRLGFFGGMRLPLAREFLSSISQ